MKTVKDKGTDGIKVLHGTTSRAGFRAIGSEDDNWNTEEARELDAL